MPLKQLQTFLSFLILPCLLIFFADTSLMAADTNIVLGQVRSNHTWKQINLPSSFRKPVVLVSPPTYFGGDPGVVRVKRVRQKSFQVRFEEWRYLDGRHTGETISYLVLDQGRHTMSDGSIWEVGTLSITGTTRWKTRRFSRTFPGTPTLLLTLQTQNGETPVTVRARRVTKQSFQAALYEEERLQNGHGNEVIGYVAIYGKNSTGTVGADQKRYQYQRKTVRVNHRFTPIPGTTADLKIEEEKSKDRETSHTKETLAILAFEGKVFAQPISLNGNDTFALRQKLRNTPIKNLQASEVKEPAPSTNKTSSQQDNPPSAQKSSSGSQSTQSGSTSNSSSQNISVTLSWKANSESDLAGYKIYQKSSPGAAFGSPIATLQKNTTSYTLSGLQNNTTYYLGVSAFDTSGNESNLAEISKSIF